MQKKLNAEMINGWRYFSNLQQLGITIGTETVDNIISAMPNKASARIIINGNEGSNIAAFPTPYGQLHIEKYVPTRVQLTYVSSGTASLSNFAQWSGLYYNNFVGWKKVIIEELPQEFDLPLTTGFSAVSTTTHDNIYGKDQFERCIVTGFISGTFGINTVIAILPAGFRPLKEIHAPCCFSGVDEATAAIGRISVNPDGQIFCFVQGAANKNALFNFNFIVS